MASEAWPEPASSILSQIQEAEREYLAAAATGNSNDPCRPISPCKNGGTCISEAGGFFYCACTESFIGRDCGFAAPNANTNSLFNLESAEKQPKVMHVQGVRSRVAAVANAAAAAASASSSSSSSTTTDNNNNSNRNMNVQSAGSVSSSDDYCSRFSPCLHGGICQSITGGYKCICKPGWVGHDCALALDANVWQGNDERK